MCLACQMEGEWLAYLEELARQELPPGPATAADPAERPKPTQQAASASPFVCEELPSE